MILDASKVKFDFLSTGFHECLKCGENRILAGWKLCPMCGESIEWDLSKLPPRPENSGDDAKDDLWEKIELQNHVCVGKPPF